MVKKYIKKIILLLITFVFLYFVFVNLDIKELIEIMKDFKIQYLFILMFTFSCGMFCRAMCFRLLMSKSAKLPPFETTSLCLTSSALNIVLPARAGDIFRAFFVGQKYNISKLKVFGAVMLERIFDTLSIFCFLSLGVFFYHRNEIAMRICAIAAVIIFMGFMFVIYVHKFNKTDQICNFILKKSEKLSFYEQIKKVVSFINTSCNSFFNGFEAISSVPKTLQVILASLSIWFFECVNFYVTILGFGYDIHWSVTLFLIGFIALACMIPSTSIFIGPYQVAIIAAFAIYDVSKETALAISIVEQAGIVIISAVVAVIFLLKNNISFKELKEDLKKQAAG